MRGSGSDSGSGCGGSERGSDSSSGLDGAEDAGIDVTTSEEGESSISSDETISFTFDEGAEVPLLDSAILSQMPLKNILPEKLSDSSQ